MKIALVHNEYGKFSGEEAVVEAQKELLTEHGHNVVYFSRSSAEIPKIKFGTFKAFMCGIYNPFAVRKFRKFLKQEKPDIVHIHNLFPLISPAILPECKKAGIPVVMTVHNYRLICPNGLFMNKTGICEKCLGGHEWNCIKYNCEKSYFKSIGYALRNWFARQRRYYLDNVDRFAVLTDFQKEKLISNGFDAKKIIVLPNMSADIEKKSVEEANYIGNYIAYAGRLSKEKGIDLILEAARRLPYIAFKLAGSGYEQYQEQASGNIEFCGYLTKEKLNDFYRKSRFSVMASICYEGFPMGLLDLMPYAKTAIVPNVGGFPEVIDNGNCGVMFKVGNVDNFTTKIERLWNDQVRIEQLGNNAQKRALELYSPEVYYNKLIAIYNDIKI